MKPAQLPPGFDEQLLEVWHSAVRATHGFLSLADVDAIRTEVPAAARQMDTLLVAFEGDAVCAFLGCKGVKIEMLFVHDRCRGKGLGRRLVCAAIEEWGAWQVDVNEQNPQAVGFYEHLGFSVAGRSPLDDAGRPFPILHLERKG